MEVIQRCKKCKYYNQLYVLNNLHFSPSIGHCIHDKHIRKSRNNLTANCEDWEEKINVADLHKMQAETAIFEINERLYQILEILHIDKDK